MAPDLCTENFLSELKGVLPSPEQIGKLNVYRNADPEEIAGLHPSDRLMVQLIKIDRLAPRLQGMLFKARFDEQITLWEENAKKLSEAGEALLHATKFKELLSVRAYVRHLVRN
jgi:cytokinesis protein